VPEFNQSLYLATLRDMARAVRAPHQFLLEEEGPPHHAASEAILESIARGSVNQLVLSEVRRQQADSLDKGVRELFERYVARKRLSVPASRHMTRAALRALISQTFTAWAALRGDLRLEANADVQGKRAPHVADLVAFRGEDPAFIFYALPMGGAAAKQSTLVRDGLPTVVPDVRSLQSDAQFYAVVSNGHAGGDKQAAAQIRDFLRDVSGLKVVPYSELEMEFRPEDLADTLDAAASTHKRS
jgi:hypothetical protein